MTSPLTFEPETHTYQWRGATVPHATQILKDLKLSPPYPDVDTARRDFGTLVHKCCYLVLRDQLSSCGALLQPYVQAFQDVIRTYQIEVINAEMLVHHDRLGYAGTLDLHCWLFGRQCEAIIDYKTGVPPECVGLQTAAYDMALSRMLQNRIGVSEKRRRFALRLLTDETKTTGKAKLVEYTDPFDYEAFAGAVQIWKWKFGRNGGKNGRA